MQKSITVKIRDNEYAVNFPTAGDLIDIEVRKAVISRSQYYGLLNNATVTSTFALDLIDTAANFSVLIPDLMEDLNVDSILDLSIPDAHEIVEAYKKQFSPWYDEWLKVISGASEDDDNCKKQEDE